METEEKQELLEALDTIDVDIREFNKLLRGFTCIENLKDTYSETASMKALVTRLQEAETLIGPASQEEVKSLRDYLVRVEPTLIGLACTEIQDLYEYTQRLSVQVLKRSEHQLLFTKTKATGSVSTKTDALPWPRLSSITLKLPQFHGDLLKWKDFWALFSSRLEKEHDLTDADKSCLLVQAMADTKAQQRAEVAIAHYASYSDAIKSLKIYYEDNRLLTTMKYTNQTTSRTQLRTWIVWKIIFNQLSGD